MTTGLGVFLQALQLGRAVQVGDQRERTRHLLSTVKNMVRNYPESMGLRYTYSISEIYKGRSSEPPTVRKIDHHITPTDVAVDYIAVTHHP